MNAKYVFSIVVIIFLSVACASQNQVKSDNESTTIQKINEKVQANNFKILANYANPMRGKSIYLTSEYDLVIRNDSAFAYLPYYGQAYSAPYGGGDGGIKFKELMKEYTIAPQKKSGEWNIKFKINTPDYNYDVSVDIFSNGKSTMYFNCSQRQPITFNGEMELDTKN